MGRKRSPLRNRAEYVGLRGVNAAMRCFDERRNLDTAAAIGTLFHRMHEGRRRRTAENIARAFPQYTEAEIDSAAERAMQNMFEMFMVDALAMPRRVTPSTWPNHVRLGGIRDALDLLRADRPCLLVTGHVGNWELLGYVLSLLGFPISALARPLDNPLLDTWLRTIRESRGMRIVSKFGAARQIPEELAARRHVGFTADQNAGDGGLFVPFFGRLASMYKSIALMAMRYDTPVIAGFARRLGRSLVYEINVTDIMHPEDWRQADDPVFYASARVCRALEEMVRIAPEQYLWIHRRWKSRPKHEREGEPVPARLAEKMRALPWMTDEEVDRIVDDSNRLAAQVRAERGDAPSSIVVPEGAVEARP